MKTIRFFTVVCILLTAMMLFTACGTKDGTTFTVGFDADFPPYGYKDDNGEYVGFDLDLAAEVCKRQGWELVKQPIDWKVKDMELNSGTIDCIWNGFTISDDRLDKYAWTDPYVDNSQVFVVGTDSNISALADLAGKTVGVQADSSALEAINSDDRADLKASFTDLVEYGDYNTAFMDLEAGAIDAVAMDIGVADYQLSSRGEKFMKLDELLSKEVYGVGFKLDNTNLRDTVQKELYAMLEDGTLAKIAQQWGLDESVCLGNNK